MTDTKGDMIMAKYRTAWKFWIQYGWFHRTEFTLFGLTLFERGEAFWTVFQIQIAKLLVGFGWDD